MMRICFRGEQAVIPTLQVRDGFLKAQGKELVSVIVAKVCREGGVSALYSVIPQVLGTKISSGESSRSLIPCA